MKAVYYICNDPDWGHVTGHVWNILKEEGYLKVLGVPRGKQSSSGKEEDAETAGSEEAAALLASLRKGSKRPVDGFDIREGETKPPSRYN